MKYLFLLYCFCLLGTYSQGQNMDQEWTRSINDPIQLMEQFIEKKSKQWKDETMNSIFTSYGEEGLNDAEYIFLQSPGLGTDFFQIGTADVGNFISKDRYLAVLRDALSSEEKASVKLARATISEGLKEYERAFELAQKIIKKDSISYQDAIEFLDNRFGYAKLEHAKTIMDKSTASTKSVGNSGDMKKAQAKIEELDRTYFDKIPLVTALIQLDEFYDILRETGTVQIPIDITWETANIDGSKSIRFFLVKDDMMVQELGIFKNNGSVSGIQLEKNIEPGENFKIMAIELFPSDKFKIAKFVTPSFSIKNETKNKVVETAKRTDFDGRKITYVQELIVKSKNITIELWDNKEQDGDIVSVYLNGESIIAKYSLTKDKKQFQVVLNVSKSNDLFLYAHNLGTIPPNTVSIEISDGTSAEKIILNSDLSSSEAVLIKVK